MTDEEVIKLARRTLDNGLCLDMRARITRSTDAEILAFARQLTAPLRDVVDRVARLNPDAGEIGAGMLADLVARARAVR